MPSTGGSCYQGPVNTTGELQTRPVSTLLWQVPFSVLAWGGAFGLMLGTSMVLIPTYAFRSPKQQSLLAARAFGKVLNFTLSTVKVTFDPGFDPTAPSVFCQNHVSVLDAFAACRSIPQPFVGMMLGWHFKIPGYGWTMTATHGIPVYPRAEGRTDELAEAVRDRAGKGLSVLAYPEAHRTISGDVGPFKRGVFFMARDAGLPVVSLAVRGIHDVNRKGSMLMTPGEIEIYVGPQVSLAGLSGDQISQAALRLQECMADFVEGRDDGAAIASLKGWRPSGDVVG